MYEKCIQTIVIIDLVRILKIQNDKLDTLIDIINKS